MKICHIGSRDICDCDVSRAQPSEDVGADWKAKQILRRPKVRAAAIPGCYALMPTREETLAELGGVFEMIAAEYGEKGLPLPADSTAIVNA